MEGDEALEGVHRSALEHVADLQLGTVHHWVCDSQFGGLAGDSSLLLFDPEAASVLVVSEYDEVRAVLVKAVSMEWESPVEVDLY